MLFLKLSTALQRRERQTLNGHFLVYNENNFICLNCNKIADPRRWRKTEMMINGWVLQVLAFSKKLAVV